MTRKEITGERDLWFSGWVRENLPDSSTGFLVSDLDFILWNYKSRRLMLIEVKTRGAKMRFWQENLFKVLDEILNIGSRTAGVEYLGFHCIRFENTNFVNGSCSIDGKVVTEQELCSYLDMENNEMV